MIKKMCTMLCCLWLASCNTVGLGYYYGDTFLLWQLDNYFDLSEAQYQWLKPRLQEHLQWHRENELPSYVARMSEWQTMVLNGMVLNGVTEADVKKVFGQFDNLYLRLANRVKEDSVVFLQMLSDEQIDHLEKYLKEANAERKKKAGTNLSGSLQERFEAFQERMEDWFGLFTDAQVDALQTMYFGWYDDHDATTLNGTTVTREEIRQTRQEQFLVLLRDKPSQSELRAWLSHWFVYLKSPPGIKDTNQEGRSAAQQKQANMAKTQLRVMQVSGIITSKQWQFLADELEVWKNRMRATINCRSSHCS